MEAHEVPWATLRPDDVFRRPSAWRAITRVEALALRGREPVVVVTPGAAAHARGAAWLDGQDPATHRAARYYRYVPVRDPVQGRGDAVATAFGDGAVRASPPPLRAVRETHWIRVRVVDESGFGVGGVVVRFSRGDGPATRVRTDATGHAFVDDLLPGACRVALGERVLYFRDRDGAGTYVPRADDTAHTLAPGQRLRDLPAALGAAVDDHRTIYYHSRDRGVTARAPLTAVREGDRVRVPRDHAYDFPVRPTGEEHARVLEIPSLLEILAVDPCFAPALEELALRYRVERLGQPGVVLRVEVTSPRFENGAVPIYTRALTDAERQDGEHTLTWNGAASLDAKRFPARFIHPLLGPFDLRLRVEGREARHADAVRFDVLYHSLELRPGPWSPRDFAPPESAQRVWVQHRLNTLGYYAGPPEQPDWEGYLDRAIRRYKASHGGFYQEHPQNYTAEITPALMSALRNGEAARASLVGPNDLIAPRDLSGDARILVELIPYVRTTTTRWLFFSEEGDTFQSNATRHGVDEENLNRPLLPLEVRVRLRGRHGQPVDAAAAVGPAPFAWRLDDPAEATATLPLDPAVANCTRTYVERGLALQNGRAPSDPTNPNAPLRNDNCHADFGGIRGAANDHRAALLPGTLCLPYTAVADDARAVVCTDACTDRRDYTSRIGRSGVLYRPSYIAGDDHVITVEIDFTRAGDAARQRELETRHGLAPGDRIRARSGQLRVWRYARVAKLVTWPLRPAMAAQIAAVEALAIAGGLSPDQIAAAGQQAARLAYPWRQVRDVFAHARIEFDYSEVETVPVDQVLTAADYQAAVAAAGIPDAANHTLRNDGLLGIPIPAQQGDGNQYLADLRELVATNTLTNRFCDELQRRISAALRPTAPTGFIVVDFLAHPPVPVIALADPGTPQHNPAVLRAAYVVDTFSIALPDGVVLINQRDPDQLYYVVAHELGHCLLLKHWEHAGGSRPQDHDTDDHDCVMSYSSWRCALPAASPLRNTPQGAWTCAWAHHRVGVYAPVFCGKCNLKLRGWNIEHALIPADSTP